MWAITFHFQMGGINEAILKLMRATTAFHMKNSAINSWNY
jgi:hypothetical protein